MFRCTQKWFKLPFALSPFAQGTFSHPSLPVGTSVHLTPQEAHLARSARIKLLTLFHTVCFLWTWQAATAHRGQTEKRMGTCTWGQGRRQIFLVHTAGDPQQRGSFSERAKCMFAVLKLHSLTLFFTVVIFFQLLQS